MLRGDLPGSLVAALNFLARYLMRFSALLPLVLACLLSALAPGLARAEKDPHGILARRVGVWNATVNIKAPVKMTFKGQEKIGWVLGHNYVLGKGFYDDKGDGKKTEVINLMTYSEKDKRYYIWEFKANGDVQPAPLTGTWDEEKKERLKIKQWSHPHLKKDRNVNYDLLIKYVYFLLEPHYQFHE